MQTRHQIASLRLLTLLGVLALPTLAQAHTGVGSVHGLVHGVEHPLTGLDHLCAMIAVGIWAGQRGGRAVWIIPGTFVSIMAIGGAMGMSGFHLPFVEEGIVLSVLILGVLIAAAVRLPLWASATIVGLFALCHGHAHGFEMPVDAGGLSYGVGFMLATACLHLLSIGLSGVITRFGSVQWIRFAGVAIALCGVFLWVS